MEVHKEFADHLTGLQKDPDRYFVWDLVQLYGNNRALADILNDLSHPPAQPLEPYSTLKNECATKHAKVCLLTH